MNHWLIRSLCTLLCLAACGETESETVFRTRTTGGAGYALPGDLEARQARDGWLSFVADVDQAWQSDGDLEDFAARHPELGQQLLTLYGNDAHAHGGDCPSSEPNCHHDDGPRRADDGGDGTDGGGADDGGADGGGADDGGADGGGADDGGDDPGGGNDPGEECDKPELPILNVKNCSSSEGKALREAYERAHYYGWRMLQLLKHVHDVHHSVGEEAAEEIWHAGDGTDSSLAYYFGPYKIGHVEALLETVEFVFETYLTKDKSVTFACYVPPKREDILRPQLLAAKLSSPCAFSFLGIKPVATSYFVGLPDMHPDYDYPTYEFCDQFFIDDYTESIAGKGTTGFHEIFHWLKNDYGLLKDIFVSEPACDAVGDNNHCFDPSEIHALAWSNQAKGARNIYAYNTFARIYGEAYFKSNECEKLGIHCFDSPWCPPEQDSDGPPKIPEKCNGEPLGTCVGGECAPVESSPLYHEKMDPFSAAHPDGDFSKDTYCIGEDVVCRGLGGAGRCVECKPDEMLGCPCTTDEQCEGSGLSCWGGDQSGWKGSQGFCWDPVEGPPPFQCQQGCGGRTDYLGNDDYYCFHNIAVVERAVCVHGSCSEPDAFCVADDVDLVCDGQQCKAQCLSDSDCGTPYGYPPGTLCVGLVCQTP